MVASPIAAAGEGATGSSTSTPAKFCSGHIERGYAPIGIFILPPVRVRQAHDVGGVPTVAEEPMTLEQVIKCFPEQRIFSANAHTFLEWGRVSGGWRAIPYDDIFRHPPAEPDDGAE